jgi:hypothetical protein
MNEYRGSRVLANLNNAVKSAPPTPHRNLASADAVVKQLGNNLLHKYATDEEV